MATPQGRPERFLAYSTAGPQRDLARDAREQPWWDEHAAFIDGLVAEGFIQLGGPLDEEGGGFLVVMARDEVEARERLRHDPWYAHDILSLATIALRVRVATAVRYNDAVSRQDRKARHEPHARYG